MKMKIKVTKDILKRSMMCGTKNDDFVAHNCAIALAVRDLLPEAAVSSRSIFLHINDRLVSIELPNEASKFISEFDKLSTQPEKRLTLSEVEFTIDLPEKVINNIGINEVKSILANSQTLELAEA